jgi:deoxyribonuclease V
MYIPMLHRWDLTPTEAITLQKELAGKVDATPLVTACGHVAGADVSYNRFSSTLYAAVLVLRTSDWTVIEEQSGVGEATFPYIPGLLSFREAPIYLELFARLRTRPEVVFVDGQGVAHPRRLGIASLLGLWLRIPTIGCAKTRLIGEYDAPGPDAGDTAPLRHHGDIIGSVVRTKPRTNPLFISTGHLIDLSSSVRLVLSACRGYRVPEPTRQAHLHVNAMRRAAAG